MSLDDQERLGFQRWYFAKFRAKQTSLDMAVILVRIAGFVLMHYVKYFCHMLLFYRAQWSSTGTPYLFISHKLAPSDTNGFSLSLPLRLDAPSSPPTPSSSHQESRLQDPSVILEFDMIKICYPATEYIMSYK